MYSKGLEGLGKMKENKWMVYLHGPGAPTYRSLYISVFFFHGEMAENKLGTG